MTFAFTTSWDDGHPLDLRIADVLARHEFRGTFFAPRRNVVGRSVMTTSELRTIAGGFEIGGHTLDHVRLDRVPITEATRQVVDGKRRIEDELGRAILGFCYPGGLHGSAIRRVVHDAGFRYARTVENLSFDRAVDPFAVPTTLQLYPHHRSTYAKNYVRGGRWLARARGFGLALGDTSLDRLLVRLLDRAIATDSAFHLWGHSWELEQLGLWDTLERFLEHAGRIVDRERRVDNRTLYA